MVWWGELGLLVLTPNPRVAFPADVLIQYTTFLAWGELFPSAVLVARNAICPATILSFSYFREGKHEF